MTSPPPIAAHGSWTVPGSLFTVSYSLPALQEIEFAVNEGFRRIPHGGVEIGGLLFGRMEQNSTSIEAFRLVECEHARGPSFVLSERDLNGLRQQLAAASYDHDLQGLQPIGWFISHTRGPLEMTDQEYALFEQFFPAPGAITLLAKPERFKPTRFAFLVRDSKRQIDRDGNRHAIILPSSGRPARAPEASPVPRAEAPQPAALAPEPVIEAPPHPAVEEPEKQLSLHIEEPETAKQPPLATVEYKPVSPPEPIHTPETKPAATPETKPVPISAAEPAATAVPPPATPAVPIPVATALPSIEEIRRRRWENLRGTPPATPEPDTRASAARAPQELTDVRTAHQQITRKMREESHRSKFVWTATLILAAVLGSAVGYWAYLQLRSANIPLTVHVGSAGLLVSWPPDQTRDAPYAAIQVDDAAAIPLSFDEKAAGQAQIKNAGDNVKVELIVQHWMRNSEGIIRYVKALKPPPPPPQPVVSPKRRARRGE